MWALHKRWTVEPKFWARAVGALAEPILTHFLKPLIFKKLIVALQLEVLIKFKTSNLKIKIMKKIILMLFVICIFSKWSNAQCDKKILWTSGNEEFTNGNGEVQKRNKTRSHLR